MKYLDSTRIAITYAQRIILKTLQKIDISLSWIDKAHLVLEW